MCFLPISDIERWYTKLNDISKGYTRKDGSDCLRKKGYDTEKQITQMEKLYDTRNTYLLEDVL